MADERIEVEFTDRYGGHMPSWLRGCHGECEAMGWTPIYRAEFDTGEFGARIVEDHPLGDLEIAAWNEAHNADEAHADGRCDGWHFVKCLDCGGSGRVSWFVTVARIPRWIVKGVRFYGFAMEPSVSPDGWTWRQRFANYLNAAFLSDLRSLRR